MFKKKKGNFYSFLCFFVLFVEIKLGYVCVYSPFKYVFKTVHLTLKRTRFKKPMYDYNLQNVYCPDISYNRIG